MRNPNNLVIEELRHPEFVSFAQIGRKTGLTRQGVWEIAKKLKIPAKGCPEGYISLGEFVARTGMSYNTANRVALRGSIQTIKLGKFRFIIASSAPRLCAVCGEPRGSRIKYCTLCAVIGTANTQKRMSWRRFHKKIGKSLPECLIAR